LALANDRQASEQGGLQSKVILGLGEGGPPHKPKNAVPCDAERLFSETNKAVPDDE